MRSPTPVSNFLATLRAVVVWCLCWAGLELVVRLSGDETRAAPELSSGVAAGIFLAGLTGLLVGAMVGVLVAGAFGPRPLGERARQLWRAARGWLREGESEDHLRRGAALIGVCAGALVFAVLSYTLGQRLVNAMAQARFIALAMLLANAVLAGVAAVFGLGVRNLAYPLLGRRPLMWFGASVRRVAALIAAIIIVAVLAVLVRFNEALEFLPWGEAFRATAACLLAILVLYVRRRFLPGKLRWALLVLAVGGWVTSGVVGSAVGSDSVAARALFEERMPPATIGLWLVNRLTDGDGDGYRSAFGGGDCAPDDAAINPAALDIPGNEVDEDCDGSDLSLASILPDDRAWQHVLPDSVPKRPPIVLITVDAFNARHMGALGYKRNTTPTLDALAARGALFERCFSQGPSTRLSFPSMFTSHWDSEIRRADSGRPPRALLPENVTLAEVASDHGYRTVAVIPTDYFGRRWKGLTQGFQRVVDDAAKLFHPKKHPHVAAEQTDAAIRVVRQKRQGPLFLWVHYFDPHPPHVRDEAAPDFGKGRMGLYDAELHLVDAQIGRLLEAIRDSLGGQAVVIVTGDHGNGFDSPRHKKKGFGFDLNTITLHVPLIVEAPFVKPARFSTLCTTLDLLPTIANLLRVEAPHAFRGDSLMPQLLGQPAKPRQALFHQFYIKEHQGGGKDPLRKVSVRTETHNLVVDRGSGKAKLWLWSEDFEEREELSADAEQAEVKAGLSRLASSFVYLVHRPEEPATPPEKPKVKPPARPKPKPPAKASSPAKPTPKPPARPPAKPTPKAEAKPPAKAVPPAEPATKAKAK